MMLINRSFLLSMSIFSFLTCFSVSGEPYNKLLLRPSSRVRGKNEKYSSLQLFTFSVMKIRSQKTFRIAVYGNLTLSISKACINLEAHKRHWKLDASPLPTSRRYLFASQRFLVSIYLTRIRKAVKQWSMMPFL